MRQDRETRRKYHALRPITISAFLSRRSKRPQLDDLDQELSKLVQKIFGKMRSITFDPTNALAVIQRAETKLKAQMEAAKRQEAHDHKNKDTILNIQEASHSLADDEMEAELLGEAAIDLHMTTDDLRAVLAFLKQTASTRHTDNFIRQRQVLKETGKNLRHTWAREISKLGPRNASLR